MEDLWRRIYRYPSEPSSSSQAGACLPQNHGNIHTNEGIQIRTPIKSINFGETGTCNDVGATAVTVFDGFASKSPHDYDLLETASSGPLVQRDQTADDDSSAPVTQCGQKIVASFGDEGQTLICNSQANSLMDSLNPLLRTTRNSRCKKSGHDHVASRLRAENGHVHKLVERQRRNTMKTLCSTLISLLPEEYQKKHALSDQLLESVKYIDHLQDTLIALGKKRDELSLSSTVKPFSNSTPIYKNLQTSQARPANVPETFPTIRVSKFSSGIQVTANTFKDQIDFSSLLLVLEEAGVEVVSATVSALNDRVFYSIHSKLPDFRHFDSAVLHGRIDQLMKGKLPSNSLIK